MLLILGSLETSYATCYSS